MAYLGNAKSRKFLNPGPVAPEVLLLESQGSMRRVCVCAFGLGSSNRQTKAPLNDQLITRAAPGFQRSYLRVWQTTQPSGQIQPTTCFVNKVFWDTAMPIHLLLSLGGFYAKTAELSSCNRDKTALKA